ncbi:MAG: zinc-ribbon domain-containing protein, partial [Myxococcota bacterium]
MDVICERCSTEYEFDETLVSERGTTVKCTNCGHLFKVYRSDGQGERPWILRRPDGSQRTLASLRELQQAITKGEVAENDR